MKSGDALRRCNISISRQQQEEHYSQKKQDLVDYAKVKSFENTVMHSGPIEEFINELNGLKS
jgi:hypothetical protein